MLPYRRIVKIMLDDLNWNMERELRAGRCCFCSPVFRLQPPPREDVVITHLSCRCGKLAYRIEDMKRCILCHFRPEDCNDILPFFNDKCKEKIVNYVTLRNGANIQLFSFETRLLKKLDAYRRACMRTVAPQCTTTTKLKITINKEKSVIRKYISSIYTIEKCIHAKTLIKFNEIAGVLFMATKYDHKFNELYSCINLLTNNDIFIFAYNLILDKYRCGDKTITFGFYEIENRYDFLTYYFKKIPLTEMQNKELWNLIVTLEKYSYIKSLRDLYILYPCDKFTFIMCEMNEVVFPKTQSNNYDLNRFKNFLISH